jgi:hypothetical protein
VRARITGTPCCGGVRKCSLRVQVSETPATCPLPGTQHASYGVNRAYFCGRIVACCRSRIVAAVLLRPCCSSCGRVVAAALLRPYCSVAAVLLRPCCHSRHGNAHVRRRDRRLRVGRRRDISAHTQVVPIAKITYLRVARYVTRTLLGPRPSRARCPSHVSSPVSESPAGSSCRARAGPRSIRVRPHWPSPLPRPARAAGSEAGGRGP